MSTLKKPRKSLADITAPDEIANDDTLTNLDKPSQMDRVKMTIFATRGEWREFKIMAADFGITQTELWRRMCREFKERHAR